MLQMAAAYRWEMERASERAGLAMQASQEQRLLEMFGCGTACIVQPVTELLRANGDIYAVPFDLTRTDTLTQRLTRALTDIHYANKPHEWSIAVD